MTWLQLEHAVLVILLCKGEKEACLGHIGGSPLRQEAVQKLPIVSHLP